MTEALLSYAEIKKEFSIYRPDGGDNLASY